MYGSLNFDHQTTKFQKPAFSALIKFFSIKYLRWSIKFQQKFNQDFEEVYGVPFASIYYYACIATMRLPELGLSLHYLIKTDVHRYRSDYIIIVLVIHKDYVPFSRLPTRYRLLFLLPIGLVLKMEVLVVISVGWLFLTFRVVVLVEAMMPVT